VSIAGIFFSFLSYRIGIVEDNLATIKEKALFPGLLALKLNLFFS